MKRKVEIGRRENCPVHSYTVWAFSNVSKTLWSFRKLVEASQQDLEDWTSLLDPLTFFIWKKTQNVL